MTELEKLQRAKMYIDKLANGINPLDDTNIPENDVVNNVRLSRCFFYVSDTLRQVIEKSGAAANRTKKVPFNISMEKLQGFPFCNVGISISEITSRLNSLIDTENMFKLSHTKITTWLINMGMLEEKINSNNKNVKRPTDQGAELGIYVEQRTGAGGQYHVVLYNPDAQHFLIDNMETILND